MDASFKISGDALLPQAEGPSVRLPDEGEPLSVTYDFY